MRRKLVLRTLSLLALFLTLAEIAFASTTWYVNGVSGSDSNNCKSPATACKTIGHAIALAASGGTIKAAATYTENLTIGISLNVIGAGVGTTIIDGGRHGMVVTIPYNPNVNVTLSRLMIRNGFGPYGGGIYNGAAGLTISRCVIEKNSSHGFGGGMASWPLETRSLG